MKNLLILLLFISTSVFAQKIPLRQIAPIDTTNIEKAQWEAYIDGLAGGTSDHSLLSNLDYANSGHTDFAGTEIRNTFSRPQDFETKAPAGDEYQASVMGSYLRHSGFLVRTSSGTYALYMAFDNQTSVSKLWSWNTYPLSLGANGVEKSRLNTTGAWKWTNYTASNSFPITPVGMLVFDSSGNIGTQAVSGVSGSGVSGRVAYWNGTSSLTNSANLTFNGTNLTVGGHVTSDNNRVQLSVGTTMNTGLGMIGVATTLVSDRTITLSGLTSGQEGTIEVTQNSTGGFKVTLAHSGLTVKKMGTNAEVNQTALSHTTIVYWVTGAILYYGFIYDN